MYILYTIKVISMLKISQNANIIQIFGNKTKKIFSKLN
jgi:hypothetical protein